MGDSAGHGLGESIELAVIYCIFYLEVIVSLESTYMNKRDPSVASLNNLGPNSILHIPENFSQEAWRMITAIAMEFAAVLAA